MSFGGFGSSRIVNHAVGTSFKNVLVCSLLQSNVLTIIAGQIKYSLLDFTSPASGP